jgi:uncharacterized lipoprotein
MKILSCLGTLILLVPMLNSCALSPQTIALNPVIDARSYPIGRGRELALEVVDKRPIQHFGKRGGVYDTALIIPRTDVAQAVRRALAERLRASEFVITPPSSAAPLAMRVEIQRIDYMPGSDPIVNEVHTRAAIQVITRNEERIITSQYQASGVRQGVTRPSESENERILNKVVAQTLQLLLEDRAIWSLLAEQGKAPAPE